MVPFLYELSMRYLAHPHRRWPIIVKPNLEPLEERYAPGKTIELLETSFLLPALLKNQRASAVELNLIRHRASSSSREHTPAIDNRPWYAAGLLMPVQHGGFAGVGTGDGAYFRSFFSNQDDSHYGVLDSDDDLLNIFE